MPGKHAPVEERFSKFFVKGSPDECWEWIGAKLPTGYGLIRVDSKTIRAHRLALELHLGRPITPGLNVLHSCDNPGCVNYSHLREGTQQENVDDMMERGRAVLPSQPPGQKLTWDQVNEIRSRVGQTRTAIAKEFGMSPSQISRIINNKTWANPPTKDS